MMLDHMGWHEAAGLVRDALQQAIAAKQVTYDLARQIPGAVEVSCSEFGRRIRGFMAP
jgi:isocitrate dehydrogenase